MSPGRKTSGRSSATSRNRAPSRDRSRDLRQRRLDLVVGHPREALRRSVARRRSVQRGRGSSRPCGTTDRCRGAPVDPSLAVFGRWRRPSKCASRRERIARVAFTESCWPATWKTSVPNASSGGSSSIHARGRSPAARRSAPRGPGRPSGGTRSPRDPRRSPLPAPGGLLRVVLGDAQRTLLPFTDGRTSHNSRSSPIDSITSNGGAGDQLLG